MAELLNELLNGVVKAGRSVGLQDRDCRIGQAVAIVAAVGRAGRVVRVSVNKPRLFKLVDRLTPDSLTRVCGIVLAVLVAHEPHDIPDAKQRLLGLGPGIFGTKIGQREQRQR